MSRSMLLGRGYKSTCGYVGGRRCSCIRGLAEAAVRHHWMARELACWRWMRRPGQRFRSELGPAKSARDRCGSSTLLALLTLLWRAAVVACVMHRSRPDRVFSVVWVGCLPCFATEDASEARVVEPGGIDVDVCRAGIDNETLVPAVVFSSLRSVPAFVAVVGPLRCG